MEKLFAEELLYACVEIKGCHNSSPKSESESESESRSKRAYRRFPGPLTRAALCMCLFAAPNKVSPTTNPLLPISGSRLYETISHDVSFLHKLRSPTLGIHPYPSHPLLPAMCRSVGNHRASFQILSNNSESRSV